MNGLEKELIWLHGRIRTPPFTYEARVEAGVLLRRLQRGEKLGMPQSRPMPWIGPACHELRIPDRGVTWRVFYFIDSDAIVVMDVTEKKTRDTPRGVLENCQRRLRDYRSARHRGQTGE